MAKELKGLHIQDKNVDKILPSLKSVKEEIESSTSFLGRTPISWVKAIVYYICYYSTVISFLTLNYYLFSKTLSPETPTYILDDSLIGSTPGLSIRPHIGAAEEGDGFTTLISYHVNNRTHADILAKQVEEVLKESKLQPEAYGDLGNCTFQNNFGYDNDLPCVLVKLNRIFGWVPEPFGLQDGKFLSLSLLRHDLDEKEEMPQDLKDFVLKEAEGHKGNETDVLNKVWISCEEIPSLSKIVKLPQSGVTYHPNRSISVNYFPFLNQKNYKTPFIMVQLQIPRISRHTIIRMECRAWAKNIHHEGNVAEGLGAVKFGILVN